MIRITMKSTGFYANKPNVNVFEFDDDFLAVDTKAEKVKLFQLSPEEIEKWFVETKLQDAPVLNRLISLHVKKNAQ